MAKKLIEVEKEVETPAAPASEEFPAISFAESEVQQVADFVNFVYKHGDFKTSIPDMKKVLVMLNQMHAHLKKLDTYIFEHRRVLASKKAAE